MKRIVVDPVNRIEGHLRLELKINEATGRVEDALSSGTAWRGIELICRDRDPRDVWAFAQRICGVCTTVHAIGALRAVEDAFQIEIPKNANYIRNIIYASQTLQDHLIHFYHLHGLDWVSPVEALKADAAAASVLQNKILDAYRLNISTGAVDFSDNISLEFPQASVRYFEEIKAKIKKVVDSGQLGIFAAHYWDHPDYALLPAELHLIVLAHYFKMLDKQRELVASHVVFGGKNPHPHYIVGGMPCSISMADMNAPINTERLAVVEQSINTGFAAVENYYLPDLLAIGAVYVKSGLALDGGGLAKERVLGFGDLPDETFSGTSNGSYHKNLLLRSNGVVENFALGVDKAVYYDFRPEDLADPSVITESVEHSWYDYGAAGQDLHPWSGVTKPQYTEPKEGTKSYWKFLNEEGKYSWLKTPKWKGKMAEVGPLARYIIVYTKIKKGLVQPTWVEQIIVAQIEHVSKLLNLPAEKWMPSTLGRTVVRGLEAHLFAYVNKYFFNKLIDNIKSGDTAVADMSKWEPDSWPKEAKGVGLHEAPRGGLSHWIVVKNGKVANYQAVVPSTWNACPRDSKAGHGPYEKSMIDTRIKIPEKPLEILKVIHSFDPCLACATHLYDKQGKQVAVVRTDPYV